MYCKNIATVTDLLEEDSKLSKDNKYNS